MLMCGDVVPDTLSKQTLAQELLHHPQDRRPFLIRQRIEHLLRLGRRPHLGADRPRGQESIHGKGHLPVAGKFYP